LAIEFIALASNEDTSDTFVVNVPAGVNDGDVIVCLVHTEDGVTINTNGAFTKILEQDATESKTAAYYRVASSEPASYTWTLGAANDAMVVQLAYSGVDNADVIDNDDDGQGNAETFTNDGVTTVTAGCMLIYGVTNRDDGGFTPPDGMDERYDSNAGSRYAEIADEILAGTGATGSRAASDPTEAGASCVAFALKPAAAGIALPPYAYYYNKRRTT
jgi:hypothetical protein